MVVKFEFLELYFLNVFEVNLLEVVLVGEIDIVRGNVGYRVTAGKPPVSIFERIGELN